MTQGKLAKLIDDNISELNALLERAANMRLFVELNSVRIDEIGLLPFKQYSASITTSVKREG